MAFGQAIKQEFKVIKKNPVIPIVDLELPVSTHDCCFEIPVLAQIDGTDELKNDRTSFIQFYDNGITDAIFMLQKFVAGEWDDIVVLSDDTYGQLFDFGFEVNSKGENLMGFILDWRIVLELQGEGTYRIKTFEDTVFGEERNQFSFEYCLMTYAPARADGTIRISYWNTGVMGDLKDDKETKDFGATTWFNEIRIPGLFGQNNSTYEDEYIKYQNGQLKWILDEQVQRFLVKTGRLPSAVHNVLRSDVLQADQILISDYNSVNPTSENNVNKYVRRNSAYNPAWNTGTKLASVEIELYQEFQNFRHKRC